MLQDPGEPVLNSLEVSPPCPGLGWIAAGGLGKGGAADRAVVTSCRGCPRHPASLSLPWTLRESPPPQTLARRKVGRGFVHPLRAVIFSYKSQGVRVSVCALVTTYGDCFLLFL